MKLSRLLTLFVVMTVGSLLLSACGGVPISGWPGIQADQDTVYVAYNTAVFAVKGGAMQWRYPPEADSAKTFYASPVLAEGQLLIGDYTNVFYSLDPASGQENWTFHEAKGRWVSAPLVRDGIAYVSNADHHVYALDIKNRGALVWKFATQQAVWASPVSDGQNLYVAGMDHFLYALDLRSGTKVWQLDLGGSVMSQPALSEEGLLYVSTLASDLVAVNVKTQKTEWHFKTENGVWASPLLVKDRLYLGDLKGKLYAVEAQTGKQIWVMEGTEPIIASVAAAGEDKLVFVTENGHVTAINSNKEILWNPQVNGKLYSTPVIAGERVVVGVNEGENILATFDLNGVAGWNMAPLK